MSATLKNKNKKISRTNPRVAVEWAVYELNGDDEPIGDPNTYESRSEARSWRKQFESQFSAKFGVFRRIISETRD